MENNFSLDDILNFSTEFDNSTQVISPIEPTKNIEIDLTKNQDDDIEVDEEDKKDIKEDDNDQVDNTDNSTDDNLDDDKDDDNKAVKAYYKFLTESQLIDTSEDFEFKGTIESLNEAKQQTLFNNQKKAFQSLWDNLSDEVKPLIDYALNGGTNIKEFWKDTSVPDYDLQDEGDQIQILREYYKETSKFNDNQINKLIKTFKDNDELSIEAMDALDSLKELKEQKQVNSINQVKADKLAQEKAANDYRENIVKTVDTLTYLPKERKGKVKAFMFNTINKNGETLTDYQRAFKSIQNNPEHLAQLADLLLDYNPDKGLSYERFKNKGRNEATNDFKKRLEQATSDIKPSQTSKKTSVNDTSTFDWRAFLEH